MESLKDEFKWIDCRKRSIVTTEEVNRMPRRGHLRQAMLAKEIRREQETNEKEILQKYHQFHRDAKAAIQCSAKDEYVRQRREEQQRVKEQEIQTRLEQRRVEEETRNQTRDEEDCIANAVASQQRAEQVKSRELRAIHQESAELRRLTEKLGIARMNKERDEQRRFRENAVLEAKQQNEEIDKRLEQQRLEAIEKEKQKLQQQKQSAVDNRSLLEHQLRKRAENERECIEEKERERRMVMEIVESVAQGERERREIEKRNKQESRRFIEAFQLQRAEQKRLQKQEEEKRDEEIRVYWQSVREREVEIASAKSEAAAETDRVHTELCKNVEAETRAREQDEAVRHILYAEEQRQRSALIEQRRLERAEALREDLISQNENLLRQKAEEAARQKAEEAEIYSRLIAQFAEEDRLEQLTAQRRHQKQIAHRQEVERMILERRQRKEDDRRQEEAAMKEGEDVAKRKQRLVDEEIRKLVEQLQN